MKSLLAATFKPIVSPVLARIHAYKGIHKGESCYLFGDGVSLKWFDLSFFSDKPAIPCGFIPFHKDFSQLHSNYFILAETWWFYPFQKTTSPPIRYVRNHLQKMYRKEVVNKYPNATIFTNITNYPVLPSHNTCFTYRDIDDPRLAQNFISRVTNCFAGSLRYSLLLAIYMGFEHCYLAGFDYTHFPSRSRHWYERGQGVGNDMSHSEAEFLQLAKQYIDITTITLDGSSNTLDHVTYANFTGQEPLYRENSELLEARFLDVFSKWPGYTIF